MVNAYSRRLAFSKVMSTARSGPLLVAPINHLGMLTDYVLPDQRVVARLGSIYGIQPGFYLLAGPDWKGKIPPGITGVFRSSTNTAFVFPRVFQDDTAEDKRVIQTVLQRISMYPLAEYDGIQKVIDWSRIQQGPAPTAQRAETRWVSPQKLLDELPLVFKDAPPRPSEEARYAEAIAVINAARDNPALKTAMIEAATQAETALIDPLLKFRNYGRQLPYNWTTIDNGGQFGVDYFTRTAVARSNMFVNVPNETRYFYQDLDADGSLTIYVQRDPPGDLAKRTNWLPAPADENFSLYLRAYWPGAAIADGQWTPPAVVAAN